MPRDAAQRRGELTTKLTILQLRAEVLRRQVAHRSGLTEEDRQWLDQRLAAIVQTARGLAPMMAEEWAEQELARVQCVPTVPLTAYELVRRDN
jgi:hypothetical protein